MSAQISATRTSSCSSGSASLTIPHSTARAAAIGSPSSTSSRDRPVPTRSKIRWHPIHPGIAPTDASGKPSIAPVDAYLKSQDSASSRPPPSALPESTAIVGTSSSAIRRNTRFPARTKRLPMPSGSMSPHSPISAPLQKKRVLAERITTTRTSLVFSICARARSISASIANDSALCRATRSSVMVATRPSM